MSNADRILKFADDQTKILVTGTKPSKITSEIAKLRTWLQKHQQETLPDAAKAKLLAVLEKYNRASSYFTDIRHAVQELFTDYLQMPEGKLVSARDKSKVLVWLHAISDDGIDNSSSVDGPSKGQSISKWSVEAVDIRAKTMTLLSTEDAELWKEQVQLHGLDIDAKGLQSMLDAGNQVLIDIDDATDTILGYCQS